MRNLDLRSSAIRLALVLWAVLCVALFIRYPGSKSYIHGTDIAYWPALGPKLARIDLPAYLLSSTGSFAGLLIFCAASAGLGASLLAPLASALQDEWRTSLQRLGFLASAFTLGQGLLSMIFLGMAELHGLTPASVAVVLIASMGVGLWPIRAYLARHPHGPILRIRPVLELPERVVAALTALVLLLSLTYSTSRLSFDSTAYYFSDAKITALTHGIQYFMNKDYVASVFQAGINYSALIQLFGDQAARMYSWIEGLTLLFFGLAIAERLGLSRRAQVVLTALILTSTALLDLLGDGKVDLVSTVPALAAIYWMIVDRSHPRGQLVLVGFLAGMAMAARPFNLLLMPVAILLLEVQSDFFETPGHGGQGFRQFLEDACWICAGAVPSLVSILATNWIILGSPIAFALDYAKLVSGARPLSFPADAAWGNRLLYPLTVTFINQGQSLGNISPLFVGLLPLGLYGPIRRSVGISRLFARTVAAAVATLLIWLLLTSMVFEIRYVFFLWVILYMPVAGWAAAALEGLDRFVQSLLRLAVIALLLFISLRTAYISLDTYSPVDSQGNAHCYDLDRCVGLYPVNQLAQPGERVLMLSAFRYYLRSDLFACATTHSEYALLERLSHGDPAVFWTEVYREGNGFYVYQQDFAVGHLYLGMMPTPDTAPPWLTLVPLSSESNGREAAYRLVARNPPVAIEKKCVRIGQQWQVEWVTNSGG